MPTKWRVEVTGLRQVFDALDEFDKQAANQLRKRIKSAGSKVATTASYLAPGSNPISNWGQWTDSRSGRNLSYEPSQVSRGFKVREQKFRTRGVSRGFAIEAYQGNAAGAIYELMGTGRRISTRSGAAMVEAINDRYKGRNPRSLFAAYYQVMTPELRDDIKRDIEAEARKAGLV